MSARPKASAICFENRLAIIAQEAQGQYLRVLWKRAPWHLPAAQVIMEQLLVCLRRTGWGKVLFKQPPMPSFPLDHYTWLLYNWLPRAQAAGGWCFALLPPRDLFAHVGLADFLSQLHQQRVQYYVASSREEAIAWLGQQHLGGETAEA